MSQNSELRKFWKGDAKDVAKTIIENSDKVLKIEVTDELKKYLYERFRSLSVPNMVPIQKVPDAYKDIDYNLLMSCALVFMKDSFFCEIQEILPEHIKLKAEIEKDPSREGEILTQFIATHTGDIFTYNMLAKLLVNPPAPPELVVLQTALKDAILDIIGADKNDVNRSTTLELVYIHYLKSLEKTKSSNDEVQKLADKKRAQEEKDALIKKQQEDLLKEIEALEKKAPIDNNITKDQILEELKKAGLPPEIFDILIPEIEKAASGLDADKLCEFEKSLMADFDTFTKTMEEFKKDTSVDPRRPETIDIVKKKLFEVFKDSKNLKLLTSLFDKVMELELKTATPSLIVQTVLNSSADEFKNFCTVAKFIGSNFDEIKKKDKPSQEDRQKVAEYLGGKIFKDLTKDDIKLYTDKATTTGSIMYWFLTQYASMADFTGDYDHCKAMEMLSKTNDPKNTIKETMVFIRFLSTQFNLDEEEVVDKFLEVIYPGHYSSKVKSKEAC